MSADEAKYRDRRSGFWMGHFTRAKSYQEYLTSSDPARAARWRSLEEKVPALTTEQRDRLTGFNRKMNVLIYSGVWCGDCVRQGPIIDAIARSCGEGVEARFIERDDSEELREELRLLGALRVPVVVFLSEDFFEIGRFGDRTLATYRGKARKEVGPACYVGLLPPPPDELAAETEEWVAIFERMLLMLRLAPMLRERYGD